MEIKLVRTMMRKEVRVTFSYSKDIIPAFAHYEGRYVSKYDLVNLAISQLKLNGNEWKLVGSWTGLTDPDSDEESIEFVIEKEVKEDEDSEYRSESSGEIRSDPNS